MRIHPTPHHPTLSTFLSSPPIHLIQNIISKITAFNPCSGRLPQSAVCVVHLVNIYILINKCSLCLDAEQMTLELRVVIRQQG